MKYRLNLWQFGIIALVITFVTVILRIWMVGPIPVGFEPYSHLMAAESYKGSGLTTQPLPNFYDLVLAFGGRFFEIQEVSFYMSALLAFLSSILLFFLFNRLGVRQEVVTLSLIIFIMSPIYLSLVLIPTPRTLALFIIIASLSLFSIKNKYSIVFAVMMILSVPFFGFAYAIISIVALGLYSVMDKTIRKIIIPMVIGLLAVSILFYGYHYLVFGSISNFFITGESFIQRYLSDFGGRLGFSTFALFMGAIGVKYTWHKKKILLPFYLASAAFIVLQYFVPDLAVYSNLSLSILSGYALFNLIQRKWKLKQIKDISMLLIACGFLFSFVLSLKLITNGQPDQDMQRSLQWLGSQDEGVVLSHYKYGQWIEYYSGFSPFISNVAVDGHNATDRLFSTRSIVSAEDILTKNQISYIFITDEMRDGLVWKKDNEGLLFLLGNGEVFTNIYNSRGYEIWEVKT